MCRDLAEYNGTAGLVEVTARAGTDVDTLEIKQGCRVRQGVVSIVIAHTSYLELQ
jgi:hypothetical protein